MRVNCSTLHNQERKPAGMTQSQCHLPISSQAGCSCAPVFRLHPAPDLHSHITALTQNRGEPQFMKTHNLSLTTQKNTSSFSIGNRLMHHTCFLTPTIPGHGTVRNKGLDWSKQHASQYCEIKTIQNHQSFVLVLLEIFF